MTIKVGDKICMNHYGLKMFERLIKFSDFSEKVMDKFFNDIKTGSIFKVINVFLNEEYLNYKGTVTIQSIDTNEVYKIGMQAFWRDYFCLVEETNET